MTKRIRIAKYLTMLGMLLNVVWFLWNPNGWVLEWEPIVAFTLTLAGFIATEAYDGKLSRNNVINQNDLELFRNFQSALPVNGVMKFLKEHDFLGNFNSDEILEINRFVYEWESPAHEFIDGELESLRKAVFHAAREFCNSIATYTSPNQMGWQSVRVDSLRNIPEHEARFQEEASIINNNATILYVAYEALVRKARTKLF